MNVFSYTFVDHVNEITFLIVDQMHKSSKFSMLHIGTYFAHKHPGKYIKLNINVKSKKEKNNEKNSSSNN